MILGGSTSLFILCSLFIKDKLYLGEVLVASIVGVIFGPNALNVFNPLTWGHTESVILELSRIVLVVQCFATGVELPKAYVERQWRSIFILVVPIMTVAWLVTSLIIWGLIRPLRWLDSLVCAARLMTTDLVLASFAVGKGGKMSRRMPIHLSRILLAESGASDGMASILLNFTLNVYVHRTNIGQIMKFWIPRAILYECLSAIVVGFVIGYIGRRLIKRAHRSDIINKESFLVFYFVLAIFCAGLGSTLGMNDVVIGFAANVGFSNDGWFAVVKSESHISDVINLLLNLAYFVFLGSLIPWSQFNDHRLGLTAWRVVVAVIMILLLRRIPILPVFHKIGIPDIKTYREALFAGHFCLIGVGAIFAS